MSKQKLRNDELAQIVEDSSRKWLCFRSLGTFYHVRKISTL